MLDYKYKCRTELKCQLSGENSIPLAVHSNHLQDLCVPHLLKLQHLAFTSGYASPQYKIRLVVGCSML